MKLLIFVALFVLFTARFISGMTVTFHGGAWQVGGSCALVSNETARILVDCGSFMGDGVDHSGEKKEVEGFPFDPSKIKTLLLTHAHQDHSGRMPELLHSGFSGRILMTEPTRALVREAWISNIHYSQGIARDWRWSKQKRNHKNNRVTLHWRDDCIWARKIKPRNLDKFAGTYDEVSAHLSTNAMSARIVSGCRTCREAEVDELVGRVECVRFGETNMIDGISVVFSPVHHLPGASAIRLEDAKGSCVFSGDLGTRCSRLTDDIQPAAKADVVFVESTYGCLTGSVDKVESEYSRFRQYVGAALKRDELVWIPAFAMDRSQRVLFELQKGIDEGEIPDVPIYVLSPTARAMTHLYATNTQWFANSNVTNRFNAVLKRMKERLEVGQSSSIKRAIVLTTSGMLDAAQSYQLLPKLVPREDVSVCIVGYQSPGTPGARLLKKEKTLRVRPSGKWFTVKVACKAERFMCFSGHGDASEVDEWLSGNRASKIYLIHGNKDSLEERCRNLKEKLGCDADIAKPGIAYEIHPKK